MTIRTRKLVGTFLLLALVFVYALLAMAAAIVLQVSDSKLLEIVYYVVAGLAWVLPAGVIVWWMQKPDKPPG
ncbi:MAG: DUF2842 domain-containing protein [Hyphomicrobiaceae bacterium]